MSSLLSDRDLCPPATHCRRTTARGTGGVMVTIDVTATAVTAMGVTATVVTAMGDATTAGMTTAGMTADGMTTGVTTTGATTTAATMIATAAGDATMTDATMTDAMMTDAKEEASTEAREDLLRPDVARAEHVFLRSTDADGNELEAPQPRAIVARATILCTCGALGEMRSARWDGWCAPVRHTACVPLTEALTRAVGRHSHPKEEGNARGDDGRVGLPSSLAT